MNLGLRSQVLKGGTYLVLRRGSAILLNLLNIVVLTKVLGLGGYGLYSSAIVIFGYVTNLSQMGITVYLIRQENATDEDFHQTFTLCLGLSVVGMIVSLIALPLIADISVIEGLQTVLLIMIFALPLNLISGVPAAILERGLRYKDLTITDLIGQLTFSAVGLTLVLLNFGIWGLLVGWWLQQVLVTVLLFVRTGYRPRLQWDLVKSKAMLGYGFSFSLSLWIWQARDLVNPLIVGHFLGVEAVGVVALTIRLVQALSFIKDATWRLSIAAFAQIQSDTGKLLAAVREGMFLQILVLGPILIAAGWIGAWIVPSFLNSDYGQVLHLFPFIAVSFLVNGGFNMHSAALYVRAENRSVAAFHLVHILLFAGVSWLLVFRIGIIGYGIAELAALPAYLVIHFAVAKRIGSFNYLEAGFMLAVFALSLSTPYLGWLAAVGLLLLPFNRGIRDSAWKFFRIATSRQAFSGA